MGRRRASIHFARRGTRRRRDRIYRRYRVMASTNRPLEGDSEEQPPLGGWPRLYALVIGELALLILLFTLFARAFR